MFTQVPPKDADKNIWLSFINDYIIKSQGSDYDHTHSVRYAETISWVPGAQKDGARALEIGATSLFQELLRHTFGYDEVHGTDFENVVGDKSYFREISNLSKDRNWYMTHYVNIEDEAWPFQSSYFDLVILCEVIEHMEVDPMYVLSEINRTLADGGRILISTPNSTSSRIVKSILDGYRPHFYMQYNRSRRLYRHNFEYDVHSLTAMLEAAGFAIEKVATVDCFNEAVPEAIADLQILGKPVVHRGDNIFALARKVGPIKIRYPSEVYA